MSEQNMNCQCNFVVAPIRETPQLNSDCMVVDTLVCNEEVQKVAEFEIGVDELIAQIGGVVDIVVGPGGEVTPAISITPRVEQAVNRIFVLEGKVVNTGFIPANINIVGVDTPLQVNLPFQEETDCPGACPQDNVNESPLQVEGTVVTGVQALGITAATIRFKVILRTTLTVTRPVITKIPEDFKFVQDVNPNRCE